MKYTVGIITLSDKGSKGLNSKESTTRVDVLVETSRDAGSIPAASTFSLYFV